MEILISTSNDIYTVTMDVVSKVLVFQGVNNFPMDVNSLREIYDTTHAGYIGLPNKDQFVFYRSNGLPIFVFGITNLPAGCANGDTLNILIDIAVNQSQLSLQQKQATASAGTQATLTTSETPTGAINGTNKTFTLANTPVKGAVMFVYNPSPATQPAQFLQYGVDFTMVGAVATLAVAPLTSSSLYAVYYH